MRPLPRNAITSGKTAKGHTIMGGALPLVCVPLVGRDRESTLSETKNLVNVEPDIIELRVDAWDCIEDSAKSVSLLTEIRGMVKELPIILTCRGHWEGGIKEVSEGAKDALYKEAIDKRLVNYVDKELKYGPSKLSELKAHANSNGVSLIISYHDFKGTPSVEFIYSKLVLEISYGADVAKIALMPQKEEDVLSLLGSTLAIRRDFPDIPLITMSMSELGMHSRLVGGLYGSDLTFAVGSAASAPGQIPVAELRGTFELLYGS
ncbi:3-dehydroquinate dehydratase [Synergistales bacterium]|nr:3-dehydroquinate dehydratase [Synergistales bacterium]